MIYQPRNVQPSGSSIDGSINNTFTMEVQTNSYVSAYQLLIVDFNNNNIYTGTKTTLTQNLYNGDILSIPVNASSVKLSNGTNYKWRVRLYQPNSDMLITYGLVQSTSTTTNVYLQPNINIKAGMTLTINSQSKTITSYDVSTGLAVVGSAFSSAPSVGAQYQVYSDFIETIPDYIVYARENPTVSINNVPTSLTLKYHTFQGVYTQSDNVPIVYHQFDLYIRNDDGTNTLVNSSGKVYSANLSYTYDGFRTGNTYLIKLTVENDMGIVAETDLYTFNVSYDIVEYLQQPLATFNDKDNAIQVSWVTPVENEATSFRSDAARGIVQSNDNTLTSVYLEPGQSISDGDVVQITNSDYSLVLDGKSIQGTRSGKNLANITRPTFTNNGVTFTYNGDGTYTLNGTATVDMDNQLLLPENYFEVSSDKYYKISLTRFSGEGNVPVNARLVIDGTSTWAWIQSGSVAKKPSANGTINLINAYIPKDSTFINLKIGIQVEVVSGESSPATSWEQYGASPSSSYPSEIECISTKNLWQNSDYETNTLDGVEITGGGFKFTRGTQTGGKYIAKKIQVKQGVAYTFSAVSNSFGTNNFYICVYRDSVYGDLVKSTVANYLNYTATKTEELYFTFIIGSAITDVQVGDIQVESGLMTTKYVPYNCVQIANTGKNLCDSGVYTLSDDTSSIIWSKNESSPIPVKIGDTLSISYYVNGVRDETNTYGYAYAYQYFADGTRVSVQDFLSSNSRKTATVTNSDARYIKVFYGVKGDKGTKVVAQVEKSSVITDYTPYMEETVNVNLNGNELCSVSDDIKDKLVIDTNNASIIKKTKKFILNENAEIALDKLLTNTARFVVYNVATSMDNYPSAISTHFGYLVDYNIDKEHFYITRNGAMYLFINQSVASTVDELKTWLSTNNVVIYYELATTTEIGLGNVDTLLAVSGENNISINTNIDSTFSLMYPYKTITGDAWSYTPFNPAGAKQTGTIQYYNSATGLSTLSSKYPFTYTPMQGDLYEVISNIYNTSGFLYLYNTPYNAVNSLYTHGYTATWSTPDGLCVLPDDFNITLQFSPDSGFFYDENGAYKERVVLVDTEVDSSDDAGKFQIIIDKNKIIFTQQPDISLESSFYTDKTQTFVLTDTGVAQINSDYIWDDTATWNDDYIWTEGGTSIERVCNHWWKVQITNTSIRVEEIFPTQ